jgi:tyramine---L-glutamate ligase
VRIFAWEYVTAGGWRDIGASRSLIAQGRMMVRALAGDLGAVPGIEVLVGRDQECDLGTLPAVVETVAPGELWQECLTLAARCDAVWPIAPETDGILEEATRLAGRPVLNSRLEALAVARSKHATARCLAAHDVPAAPTVFFGETPPPTKHGWVIKPDDGAGAAKTRRVSKIAGASEVPPSLPCRTRREGQSPIRAANKLRRPPLPGRIAVGGAFASPHASRTIIQPFLPGTPLSLSLLAQDGAAWLLSCNRQHIANTDGSFAYLGGIVGGAEERRDVLEPLAARIAEALPGLWGYVGVDLIDTADGPVVLEINPRLTTSYVGLRDSIGLNPAALVLGLLDRPLGALSRRLTPRAIEIAVPTA